MLFLIHVFFSDEFTLQKKWSFPLKISLLNSNNAFLKIDIRLQ